MKNCPKKVLVVEDEVLLREILREDLESNDWKVLEAGDGEAALQTLKTQKVDVILSDVKMPKKSGIEMLRDLSRTGRPFPPVVLATAFADLNEEEAGRLGAHAVLTKPYALTEVLEVLEAASGTAALKRRKAGKT